MQSWGSEASLDRADNRRRVPEWVLAQWRRPDARVLVVDPTGLLATDEAALGPVGIQPHGEFSGQRHLFLGLVDGVPWFTTQGEISGPAVSLRHLGAVAHGAALELAVGAVALTAWHRLEPHCPGCGARTRIAAGGSIRRCPLCGRVQFPRHDPAVIVAVVDPDDRLLLGRQPTWDPGRMSVLAGFVEAGESLEQAVHREVQEEAGVRLGDVRYFGSQPWPFPRSLMVGFVAHATDPAITLDREEIEEARWFTRAELTASLAVGEVLMPGQASIAHQLVTAWREQAHG